MNRRLVVVILASLVSAASLGQSTGQKSSNDEKANLVPLLHHPMDGRISVKNVGDAPAGPSKLTLDCVRLGAPVQMNSCPDLPPSVAETYFDPMFPKNATIQVPALAPREVFTHTLSFWSELAWPTGKYKFIAVADASHVVSESKAKNNTTTSTLIVP